MTDYNQMLVARGLAAPVDPAEPGQPQTLPAEVDYEYAIRRTRSDGWTRERQAVFVEAIAQGCTVAVAASNAGMSPSGAYALRDRPEGRAFAIGWDAASIASRRALADACVSRAIHGYWESVDYDGKLVRRHKFDNRHARAMLTRLDRLAQGQRDDAVARLAAADLGGFVDALETGDDAAETMLAERAARGLQSRGAYGTSSPLSPLMQESPEDDPSRPMFWQQEGIWWTDAPTPPGFDGKRRAAGGGLVAARACTAQEREWFELEDDDPEADADETYRAWLAREGIEWSPEVVAASRAAPDGGGSLPR